MKPYLTPIIASLMTVAVAGAASAAGHMSMSRGSSMAKDTLALTSAQETTAWKDISKQAAKQTPPASFAASVGAAVPGDIALHAIPRKARTQVPALRPYDYALLPDKLLIVNPNDKKVVDVISSRA